MYAYNYRDESWPHPYDEYDEAFISHSHGYGLPDLINPGTYVKVRACETRVEDNIRCQFFVWNPAKVLYSYRDTYKVHFKNSNGEANVVNVKKANAYYDLRCESSAVRDARVAEDMAQQAVRDARYLVQQKTLPPFIRVGIRVMCRVCDDYEIKAWPAHCYDCKYITGTVKNIAGGWVWLQLDVIMYGMDEHVVRYCDVAACLSPFFGV